MLETSWEQQLAFLLSNPQIDPANQPLALQVEDAQLVPLRLDSKNVWSTRRARWRDLTSRWISVTAGLNPAQLASLRELFEHFSRNGVVAICDLGEGGSASLRECYDKGVEIFSSPAREYVCLPADIPTAFALSITDSGRGLSVSSVVQSVRADQACSVVPGFQVSTFSSRRLYEALAKLFENPVTIPASETDYFWARWEYWTEQTDLDALLTPESRQLVKQHQFGSACLYGLVKPSPQDSRQLEFEWSIRRKSTLGKSIQLPLDTQNPGRLENKLMLRLGAHLGWREEVCRNFFNHVFPIWELPRLRDLVAEINDSGLGEAAISPGLDQVQVFSEAPEIALDISDDEAGDYHLQLEWVLGKEKVNSTDFLPALSRSDRWWQSPQGNWVDLHSTKIRQLQAIIREFNQLGLEDFEQTGWKIDISQLGLVEAVGRLSHTRQFSSSWQESAMALLHPQAQPVPKLPQGSWRPYQEEGFRWLYARAAAGMGGILADDMGLGKTLQMLAVVSALKQHDSSGEAVDSMAENRNAGRRNKPVLVIVPASLLSTWEEQSKRWFPQLSLLVQPVSVGKTSYDWEQKYGEVSEADLIITTYTLARIDIDFWETINFSGLIFDEAQALKNPCTNTHKALVRLKSRWAFALSGTPLENRERDLWSIFALTVPRLLPPLAVFERGLSAVALSERSSARQTLSLRVAPFLLRRTKEAVAAEIPAKTEQRISLNLEPCQMELYQKYLLAARAEASRPQAKRVNVLTALTRLRQIALSAKLINSSLDEYGAKVTYLLQSLTELSAQNHNILVFSQFTSFLGLLRQCLEAEGLGYAYLDGATRDRAGQVDFFQQGSARIFLISLKSGGFGLNLTAADYVFLCDPWWNPAVEAQAVDRAHRIGQTRPVSVYRLVAKNTIEEKVLVLQEKKRELYSQILTAAENRQATAQITLSELRALLE